MKAKRLSLPLRLAKMICELVLKLYMLMMFVICSSLRYRLPHAVYLKICFREDVPSF